VRGGVRRAVCARAALRGARPPDQGPRLMSAASARPGFGPTLPALLRRRFGIPPIVTLAVFPAIALAGAVAIVIAIARPPSPGTQVVHASPPVFNLLYQPAFMHVARP